MTWMTKTAFLSAAVLLAALFLPPAVSGCRAQDEPPAVVPPQEEPAGEEAGQKDNAKIGKTIRIKKPEEGEEPRQRVNRKPNPTPIPDIAEYRKQPLDFITSFKERPVIDLENVDFGADVLATVNGRPITREEFRKNIVDSCGFLELKRLTTIIVTENMKKELIAAGADPAAFEVSEEMVDREIENLILLEKQQDRSGEFDEKIWREMIEKSFGWQKFRDLQRSFLAFGMVYLPEIEAGEEAAPAPEEDDPFKEAAEGGAEEAEEPLDPSLPVGQDSTGKDVNIYMPLHTWKVLSQGEMNMNIRDSLNEAYYHKRPLGNFLRPQYIQSVEAAVIEASGVEYHSSGNLPEDVYMRIGDTEVKLDEVYPLVAGGLTDEDRRQVLSEMLVYACMDEALGKGGWRLSDEEFAAAFGAHEKEYEGTLFPIEFIMTLQGYHMKEDYKKMYLRRASFHRKLESEGLLADENLNSFFENGARLFYANGGVQIQSVFFGVFDHKKLEMREGGYAWAHEMADRFLAELKEAEGGFLAVAKKYEDVNGFERPAETEHLTRNDLRTYCGEFLKSILTEGYSVADDIFYNAAEGAVIGPLAVYRGDFGNPTLKGVYIYKVIGYRTMYEPRSFEKCRPTVLDDYIELSFMSWASRLLREADIAITHRT